MDEGDSGQDRAAEERGPVALQLVEPFRHEPYPPGIVERHVRLPAVGELLTRGIHANRFAVQTISRARPSAKLDRTAGYSSRRETQGLGMNNCS